VSADGAPEPRCGGCGEAGENLFFIPGGWGWTDDEGDGRTGLCGRCGRTDERYREQFARHFGEIRFVSDSDAGRSADAVTRKA
jgi:hypothetical protein